MKHSDSIKQLMEALVKARSNFKAVHKNAANPFFKSKYSDLSEIIAATHEALNAQGISVIQSPGRYNAETRACTLTTLLAHTSSEWLEDEFEMLVVKADSQGIGSAVSYARRYSLQSFLNIAADLDDDSESAVEHDKPAIAKPQPLKPPAQGIAPPQQAPAAQLAQPAAKPAKEWDKPGCITAKQGNRLWAIGRARKLSDEAIRAFIAQSGFEATEDITKFAYEGICSGLEVA